MPIGIVGLILLSVTLSALAQISLKIGMSSPQVSTALAAGEAGRIALSVVATPHILTGLACYGLGMVVWLAVLAKVDVTMAYPFVGLGFLVTLALGVLLLGETLTPVRLVGTLLVVLGVVLTAQS
ncbi:small multi-drug resistant family protein [Azospirillum thiophilum]|uniref:Small multi-drug resistant family protein n=1 Tax=Azospirillum thiophilum TaxID=528244 RepID=A0AAC8W023_9PROT|nr:EamA family transporter [Azospirillum thiophilum]ALG72496.1 small multi-drug resistant family protein [Azospirillum thiophilum]KJR61457.1 small multi-drug resistant family protein [Azospirillum thiophilum]